MNWFDQSKQGANIELKIDNKLSFTDIYAYLYTVKDSFYVPLDKIIDLKQYAEKLCTHAIFFTAVQNKVFIGIIAAYMNDTIGRQAYISFVSIKPNAAGHGIGTHLLKQVIKYAKIRKFHSIKLEVHKNNAIAKRLYSKLGFKIVEDCGDHIFMQADLTASKY